MRVALQDGRKLEVPLAWFPQLDEDLSVRGLLFPHPEDAQRVGG